MSDTGDSSSSLSSQSQLRIKAVVAKVQAWLQLGRLPEALIVAGGSWVGAFLAAGELPFATVVLVMFSNALLFSSSVALNDWRDLTEDAINRPDRPIPSGRIDRRSALAGASAMFGVSVGLAFLVSSSLGILAALVTVLSSMYTLRWKRVPLLGNVTVAALSTYPLWCWISFDVEPSSAFLALMVACFLFRVGAELAKTGEDHGGDRAASISTVATLKGIRFANGLGTVFMCGAIVPLLLVPGWSLLVQGGLLAWALLMGIVIVWIMLRGGSPQRQSQHLVNLERTIMSLMVGILLLDGILE